MKQLVTWLYKRCVDELYVPAHQTFSVSYRDKGKARWIWESMLPDVLVLRIKDLSGKWQDVVLER